MNAIRWQGGILLCGIRGRQNRKCWNIIFPMSVMHKVKVKSCQISYFLNLPPFILIFNCYCPLNSPAMVEHSRDNPMNPTLTIYLEVLEVRNSTINCTGFSSSFESIIYHLAVSPCLLPQMMLVKNNGPGDSTPDAETRMTSPANAKGFILCLQELFLTGSPSIKRK